MSTALRLLAPSASWDNLRIPAASRVTLREFYESRALPLRTRKAARTVRDDWQAVRAWERWGTSHLKDWKRDSEFGGLSYSFREPLVEVSNPPIGIVISEDMERFRDAMLAAGQSPVTVNQKLRHLDTIWKLASPQDGHNKFGQNVILRRPVCEHADVVKRPNVIPTMDDLRALWAAVPDAATALEYRDADWWRALIVCLCCYAFRPQDFRALEWSSLDWQGGRMKLKPKKTLKRYGAPLDFPLIPIVSSWLRRLQALPLESRFDHVFCGSTTEPFRLGWNAIVAAAGLSIKRPDCDGKEKEMFEPYALRRFCNVWLSRQDYGLRAGEWMLNHAFKNADSVNVNHYTNFLSPPEPVERLLLTCDWPECFYQLPEVPALRVHG